MYLEFVWNTDGTPIPHLEGRLHYPLSNYLIYLRTTFKKRGGRREPQTIINSYTIMKIWFDFCADLGVSFDEVTFEPHLTLLRTSLLERGVSVKSVNTYYRAWRSFYEWCELEGISYLIQFPTKISRECNRDYGSSVRKLSLKTEIDPGLLAAAITDNYKDFILNPLVFSELSIALRNVDPVFEMIAYMMVTTGLRIGGVVQIPVGANERNRQWLRYPELLSKSIISQKLVYLPKGNKRFLSCIVLTEALGKVHEEYIQSHRVSRSKLFKQKHPGVEVPLWLNENGKEVYNYDVWNAFRSASKKLGRNIRPHYLRHTYATYVVYNYFCAHGLKPNLSYAHDIHEQLSKQLGHSDIEVTKIYIRTIIAVEMEAWLPLLTPHVKLAADKNIPYEVLSSVKRFFEPEPIMA